MTRLLVAVGTGESGHSALVFLIFYEDPRTHRPRGSVFPEMTLLGFASKGAEAPPLPLEDHVVSSVILFNIGFSICAGKRSMTEPTMRSSSVGRTNICSGLLSSSSER